MTKKRMMLYSGTIHPTLAHEIADNLGIPVSEGEIRRFASGEIYFRAEESVRGADVFVVQTHYEPVNEAIVEQLIMIDAMKRASAKRITAVVPYYGYSRQDKKAVSREYRHADLAFRYKRRSRTEAHKIEEMTVVGEVDGRPCVLVDDMIDTGATLTEGVKALAAMGAGPIFTGATHALFSGKARQHL